MPAIWPPLRPLPESVESDESVAAAEDEVALAVAVGNNGGMELVDGRVTPGHLRLTSDAAQQESVELGEL